MKTDIGLKLLSLYRDITVMTSKTKNSIVSIKESDDFDISTVEGMTSAILSSLETGNCYEAYSLLTEWTMNYPLENESSIQYNYLSVEIFLRMMDGVDDVETSVRNLNLAIDAANTFFMVNSGEGHPMDEIAKEVHERLLNIIGSFDDDTLEEYELRIENLESPILLPLKEDISIEGRLKKAIEKHKRKYGNYLQNNERNLIKEICTQLEADYLTIMRY